MKSTPLLMKAEMVRATLMNIKTVTRRTKGLEKVNDDPEEFSPTLYQPDPTSWGWSAWGVGYSHRAHTIKCPYGQAGDELWVKECWKGWLAGDFPVLDYKAGMGDPMGCNYPKRGYDINHPCFSDWKWRSSLFMPKWASRISFEILSIRPERLHDITRTDCVLEGIETLTEFDRKALLLDEHYIGMFAKLWNSINGKNPLLAWKANPWVWRIEYRMK